MKILINEGLRQIDSHIAKLMIDCGDKVCVIHNLATGRNRHLEYAPNLRFEIASIANNSLVQGLFVDFKPDCVIHAAASYKDPNV